MLVRLTSRGQIAATLTRDLEDYGDAEDGLDEEQWGEKPSRETGMRIKGE